MNGGLLDDALKASVRRRLYRFIRTQRRQLLVEIVGYDRVEVLDIGSTCEKRIACIWIVE
jgi:hypothetical protein